MELVSLFFLFFSAVKLRKLESFLVLEHVGKEAARAPASRTSVLFLNLSLCFVFWVRNVKFGRFSLQQAGDSRCASAAALTRTRTLRQFSCLGEVLEKFWRGSGGCERPDSGGSVLVGWCQCRSGTGSMLTTKVWSRLIRASAGLEQQNVPVRPESSRFGSFSRFKKFLLV